MKDPYNRWAITGPGIPPDQGQMELQAIAYNNLKRTLDNTREALAEMTRQNEVHRKGYYAYKETDASKGKSIAILKATIRELIRDD